jgi:hypothetical protein
MRRGGDSSCSTDARTLCPEHPVANALNTLPRTETPENKETLHSIQQTGN